MTHVEVSAWIGKHRQAVEFFLAWVFCYLKTVVIVPIGLCGNFYVLRWVILVNGLHAISVVFTR